MQAVAAMQCYAILVDAPAQSVEGCVKICASAELSIVRCKHWQDTPSVSMETTRLSGKRVLVDGER